MRVEMRVDMLGPAVFRYGDRVIELRPLEKVIHMAVYLAGGTLSTGQLAEDVWTIPTPGSAATLRGCLSKARAKVVAAGGAAEQLSWTVKLGGGRSVVRVPDSWKTDIMLFQQHASEANTAYASGRCEDARNSAARALALWYHDPLPDAGQRPFAAQFTEQLRGLHWATVLTRIKAEICLGRYREVTAQLKQLVDSHPEEISLAGLLATVLYRCDLVAEATRVCQEAIADLGSKGVDAHRLQHFQYEILTGTAALSGPPRW